MEQPPIGSRVRDRHGQVWAHEEHGFDGQGFYGFWHLEGSDELESWVRVQEFGPLTILDAPQENPS